MATPPNDNEPDISLLTQRIDSLKAGEAHCRCIILRETLVPGQRLMFTAPPALTELFANPDSKPVILLGQPDARGGRPKATYGVEATLDGAIEYRPVVPNIHPEGTADLVLRAGRLCEVLEMEDQALGLQRSAYVQWTDLDLTDGEPFSAAVLDRSRELEASVEQWIRLVRRSGRECSPTHLDDVLEHLGKMPPEERPNARALWVAGLLNPLPSFSTSVPGKFAAMGPTVAPEIRAATLSAAGAEARLGTIRTALSESMRRLAKMVGDD